jgi:hypothetical protein
MKTYIPHFEYNEFIIPPEGYFILPLGSRPDSKKKDKYYLYSWKDTICCSDVSLMEPDFTYARLIKGNETLYNKMAFLPEKIVNPPEGYYLLPANVKLKRGDIGYWKQSDKWDLESSFRGGGTPFDNYKIFGDVPNASIIAFARKIEIKKDKKMKPAKNTKHKIYNPLFNVRLKTEQEVKDFIQLIKDFDIPFQCPTANYLDVFINRGSNGFYFIFENNDILGWNPVPYQTDTYFTYENFDVNEITNHIIAVTGKTLKLVEVDYLKYPNFQVKIENEEQFDAVTKLAEEYKGKFILAKMSVEENQEKPEQYEVMSIPAVKLFKNGKVVEGFIGAMPESQVKEWLDSNL